MTVKALKDLLKNAQDNDLVVLSKDAEGNAFKLLGEMTQEAVEKAAFGFDIVSGQAKINSVVLWPV